MRRQAYPTQDAKRWGNRRPGEQISPERLNDLMEQSALIEGQDAWAAGAVRYAGRYFVQANLPHSIRNIDQFASFTRSNGNARLRVTPSPDYGIPYGSLPRLILIWIADEVRRTQSDTIILGDNLSKFMRTLDIVPTGGRWGTVIRLRDQMLRLFNAEIRFKSSEEGKREVGKFLAIDDYDLWWDKPDQSDLFKSSIHLTRPLYEEMLEHSFPVDMRAVKALRASPMELDIYDCLTLRMMTLNRPLFLPYAVLSEQFGAQYKDIRFFARNLDKALWAVLKQYPQCRVEPKVRERGTDGWRLLPSPTHVPQKKLAKK
jgi:hypothetical protein